MFETTKHYRNEEILISITTKLGEGIGSITLPKTQEFLVESIDDLIERWNYAIKLRTEQQAQTVTGGVDPKAPR